MKCRECNRELPETNYSGVCGACAFNLFQVSRTNVPRVKKADIEEPDKGATGDRSGAGEKADGEKSERATPISKTLEKIRPAEPVQPVEPSRVSDRDAEELNVDIEQTILNGFIHDQYLLGKAMTEGFQRDMLRSRAARTIFIAIEELVKGVGGQANTIDEMILKKKLDAMKMMDDQMRSFLDKTLSRVTPQLSQVLAYMRILRDQLSKEKLREVAEKISRYIKGEGAMAATEFVDFAASITKEIRDMQRHQTRREIELIKSQMIEIAHEVDERERVGEIEALGYSLKPFIDLNTAISGLRRGFLYGIAGAPRRGKTNFTLDCATYVATNDKIPVLFFTWEQTKKNLTYRLLAKETRINADTLQRKRIRNDADMDMKFALGWRKMEAYMDKMYIIEGSKQDTIDRIKAHAYNAMQDCQVDEVVIVCDYLQKMPLSKNYDSEKFRVEEISTDLKRLSIELNCPIVVISSLSKEGCMIELSGNKDERPSLYHCKGSGDLEYDLDCAMVLSRDVGDSTELIEQLRHKAEDLGKDPIHVPKIDIINCYIDKNRDAPEGVSSVIQYFFFIEENKFIELGFKNETNAYRFGKIENLMKKLIEDRFIEFRDVEGAKSGSDGDVAMRRKIGLKK
jgi:replicative DNA helicase